MNHSIVKNLENRYKYKGLSLLWYPRDFVENDVVEVYEVDHTSNIPFVSVKKWTSDHKLEDTGKKVEVSIRSSYRNGMGRIPKLTILLLVICFWEVAKSKCDSIEGSVQISKTVFRRNPKLLYASAIFECRYGSLDKRKCNYPDDSNPDCF